MSIEFQAVTYNNVLEGEKFERDDFGLASYLTETRKKALFANPNLKDYTECLMSLERVDGVIAGRSMLYPSKIVIDGEVAPCQSSTTLDVPEQFRHLGLGANLFYYLSRLTPYDYVLCSGISESALPLYKAMKYHILEFPRAMYLCDAYSLIEHYGFRGLLLKSTASVVNLFLRMRTQVLKRKSSRIIKKYDIRKESIIPEWVEDIVLHDGHKYLECHNREWMQWNLDYNFKGDNEDVQSFYSISFQGKPIGFFMTKERYRLDAGGKLKNIVLGAIVEWGSKDFSILDESDIVKMAFSTFSPQVDIIEYASANNNVISGMKKWGFIKHGNAHIAFKDKTKKCKDASDIHLWRVRYGYADVILT